MTWDMYRALVDARAEMYREQEAQRKKYVAELRGAGSRPQPDFLVFDQREAVGPLTVLLGLSDQARAQFTRIALSQPGMPRFKDFWEGRRLCLPLFKENLTPKVRSQLWAEYIELSSEARRFKAEETKASRCS